MILRRPATWTPPPAVTPAPVDYRTDPSQYRHWKLSVEGALARLTLDIAEDAGVRPGYKLKLNSYDLGVDIELADALNRVRFEHPEVRSVIVTSGKDRVFCSGANIFMLGVSSHAWKVNFCKFTNETRNGIEDTSRAFRHQVRRRGQRRLRRRRLRAGPGLRRDHPGRRPLLLGLAARGAAARRAARHRRPDPRHRQAQGPPRPRRHLLHQRRRRARPARGRVAPGRRGRQAGAVRQPSSTTAPPSCAEAQPAARRGEGRRADAGSSARTRPTASATRTSTSRSTAASAPRRSRSRRRAGAQPADIAAIEAAGAAWWPLAMARQLDDAILNLRTNELEIGTWILKTDGDAAAVLAADATMLATRGPLAGARDARPAAPHLRPPRRLLAHACSR